MHIEVARGKILILNEESGFLKLSWWRECENSSLISFCDSVRDFGSSTGQQQMVNTEAVVSGTALNEEEYVEFKRL